MGDLIRACPPFFANMMLASATVQLSDWQIVSVSGGNQSDIMESVTDIQNR
jgi:hypothetical protein